MEEIKLEVVPRDSEQETQDFLFGSADVEGHEVAKGKHALNSTGVPIRRINATGIQSQILTSTEDGLTWAKRSTRGSRSTKVIGSTIIGILLGCTSSAFRDVAMKHNNLIKQVKPHNCISIVCQTSSYALEFVNESEVISSVMAIQTWMKEPLLPWTYKLLMRQQGYLKFINSVDNHFFQDMAQISSKTLRAKRTLQLRFNLSNTLLKSLERLPTLRAATQRSVLSRISNSTIVPSTTPSKSVSRKSLSMNPSNSSPQIQDVETISKA